MALVVATALLAAGASSAKAMSRGDVSVLALIPAPGYPALPHVVGNLIYEGTYANPAGDSMPSRVLRYTADGTLLNSWTVQGQNLSKPHGVQVAANDAQGRLLLLDKTSGRIIRLDPRTGEQTLYSEVPDLPTCGTSAAGTPCSPALVDQAPMPDHRTLLFDQASNGGLGGLNPATGKLYTVPIQADGSAGPLTQLWESGPADAPDGCALAASEDIYLALVGASNQIVELSRRAPRSPASASSTP